MNIEIEMTKGEAGDIVQRLLRNDYFSQFSANDRVEDPDGLYAIESEMTHIEEGEEFFNWNDETRTALSIVAKMTPAERREYLEIDDEVGA